MFPIPQMPASKAALSFLELSRSHLCTMPQAMQREYLIVSIFKLKYAKPPTDGTAVDWRIVINTLYSWADEIKPVSA